ncbi:MAG: DUF4388 domain-containing protein [Calditrichaeota bacterium]|nr:MAG: DUF4388 domain-containing protein [Calditrichota bacterium]MBL1206773.1 DUF4388 domain-containing protein [Calditrichota bacterium]NOG46599.1 DUF4388 domain-containing protein [Calditrichota bacterium]
MSQYSVVILDTDDSRTDYFESMFKKDDHVVSIYGSIGSIIQHAENSDKVAFLVEYNTLTAENRLDVIKFFKDYSRQNVFMFNVPDNANKRLAFYELGAKRVFDTSHPLDEIYYALIWPIKNMVSDSNKNLLISSGQLEDVSLKSLINNLAREERSGILKIVTENNSGKVYFRDGYITHAQVGLHVGEKAVLHMLFWHTGEFIFNATTSFNDTVSVSLSIVTLLIIAEDLRKSYLQNLQEIGSQKAIVQVTYSGDLNSSSIEINNGFKDAIIRPAILSVILENQFYTCYETAQKLIELKNYGFLSVTDAEATVIEKKKEKDNQEIPLGTFSLLDNDETLELCHNVSLEKLQSGKILIISTLGKSSYHALQSIVQNGSDIHKRNNTHVCRVEVLTQTDISFYSLTMDETVLESVGKISDEFTAIAFLVDVQKTDVFEYTSYVMHGLIKNEQTLWAPFAINSTEEMDLEQLKSTLNIPEHIPFIASDPTREEDVKQILLSLKKYIAPQPEEPDVEVDQDEEL